MIHQQPPIEQPATRAHPVNPGRSSQESTASARSGVDVARLFERLDWLEAAFDELGIPPGTVTTSEQSPPLSIENLTCRIERLRKLFDERTRDFPARSCPGKPLTEQRNHIN